MFDLIASIVWLAVIVFCGYMHHRDQKAKRELRAYCKSITPKNKAKHEESTCRFTTYNLAYYCYEKGGGCCACPCAECQDANKRWRRDHSNYWTFRRRYLAGEVSLDAMLKQVTLDEPDMDDVTAEPWPQSRYPIDTALLAKAERLVRVPHDGG